MTPSLTVAVLAGGHSSRMGTNKSFVMLAGKTMIQHVLDRVQPLDAAIILIANQQELYRSLGLPVFSDVLPDAGSLGGIYTALTYSPTEYVLCVACDMPYLNPALLHYLASLGGTADIIVPRIRGYPEALHAIYRKTCLEPIRQKITEDRLKVIGFYDQMRVQYVAEAAVRDYDPELRSFQNVNTPEQLAEARAIIEHPADDTPP